MLCYCEIVFLNLRNKSKDYYMRSWGENALLNNQLWEYNKELGVDGYIYDDSNLEQTVRWRLQDHYYTTSQIERIKKIRVFL